MTEPKEPYRNSDGRHTKFRSTSVFRQMIVSPPPSVAIRLRKDKEFQISLKLGAATPESQNPYTKVDSTPLKLFLPCLRDLSETGVKLFCSNARTRINSRFQLFKTKSSNNFTHFSFPTNHSPASSLPTGGAMLIWDDWKDGCHSRVLRKNKCGLRQAHLPF